MKNAKPKRLDRKVGYKEAIKTIDRNINGIWNDSVINTVLTDIGSRLRIDEGMYKGLYEAHKDEMDKIHDIHELVQFLTKEWADQIFKDEREREILTKKIAREQISQELVNTKTSKEEIEQIASGLSKSKTDWYLRSQIDTNYMLHDSFLIFPVRVNLKIWKGVVDAMLFNVPIEKILECKQSILEKDYLPTANIQNGFLNISINELTSQTDMLLAWDRIEEKQNEYKSKYGYLQAGRGSKDAAQDRILLDLNFNQDLKPKIIYKTLPAELKTGLTPGKITQRLKEIRKRARVSKAKEMLLKHGEKVKKKVKESKNRLL